MPRRPTGRTVHLSARLTPEEADRCKRAALARVKSDGRLMTLSDWVRLAVLAQADAELGPELEPRDQRRR